MSFLLSSELTEFAEVLRKFLAAECSPEYRRSKLLTPESGAAPAYSSDDAKLWQRLSDMGVISAGRSEDCAGLGFGALGDAVVLEASGSSLLPQPLFESLCFGSMLELCAEQQPRCKVLLDEWVQGKRRISGIMPEGESIIEVSRPIDAQSIWLTGRFELFSGLEAVNSLLLPLRNTANAGAIELYHIDIQPPDAGDASQGNPAERIKIAEVPTFDLLRSFSAVEVDQQVAEFIGIIPAAVSLPQRASLCAVSELSGIAGRVVEMTAEYVRTRQQFGRPVGSFQAVQHKMADMYLWSEQARSLSRFAAWASDADRAQFAVALFAAKGFAGEYVPQLCEQAIQLHGGIGFTADFDLHLYLRRALMLSKSFLVGENCYAALADL
jgi:acyl-CoA dehydrogenase